MYLSKYISVIIPAYNEESLIFDTLNSVPDYIDKIIIINDGSTDSTKEKIENFIDERLIFVNHKKNMGVGYAIISGYEESLKNDIDITIVMDGDGQMDPKYIPDLIEPIIRDDYDYVKGNRLVNKNYRHGMSKWRQFGNIILSFLTKISSGYWHINDPQNAFTAISNKTLKKIDFQSLYPRYGYPNHLLSILNVNNCKVINVPIPSKYGNEKSKIVYHKYIYSVSILLIRCFVFRINNKYLRF